MDLLEARQLDTLAALDRLEAFAVSGPEEARALLDARGERLTCRQRRLLDALRTLCARQHLEVDLSPHAAALLPVSAKSEEPIIVINGKAGPTERRLHAELLSRGVRGARFFRVPSDYYNLTLEKRASLLCAPSVYHLCKSILLENENAPAGVTDCSRYYLVIVQYKATLDVRTKLRDWLVKQSGGKLSKSKVKLRLAPPEVDLKLGFNCQQFLHGYAVHAVDCTLDAAPANDLLDDDEL